MRDPKLIAIDLAKSVFQVCLLDESNNVIKNRQLRRAELMQAVAQWPSTTIAMEACYSSHFWGRFCERHGHTVRLIPAQHVKPFVRGNKNDHNDALAIAEAAQRPMIRTVPVKSVAQQDVQCLHRIRERLVKQRTALVNQTRGMLADYGVLSPCGLRAFNKMLVEQMDEQNTTLSPLMKQQLSAIHDEMVAVSRRLDDINRTIEGMVQQDPIAKRLKSIPGVGVLVASAMSSAIGNGAQFNHARDLSVWLGLTPKHAASGTKLQGLGISKRGNQYLRKQLCHGARAALCISKRDSDPIIAWARRLRERRGVNKAVVALASRIARVMWTLLRKGENYREMPA